MHELLWTRRCVDLLGASAESTSRVLGAFFLGLALGAALAAKLVAWCRRPWIVAGLFEIAVAVFAMPIMFLPWWSDGIWQAIGPDRLIGWEGQFLKLILSLGLVGLPAFCMGVVLPLIIAGVIDRTGSLGRQGVWLYAINTFGGAVGLLLLMGLLLPMLGSLGAMAVAAALNLIVGGLCCVAGRNLVSEFEKKAVRISDSQLRPKHIFFLSFCSGFAVLAFEVVAFQLAMLFAPFSFHAPMILLFAVLSMLGVSSATIALQKQSRWRIGSVLLCAGVATGITPLLFQVTTRSFSPEPSADLSTFLFKIASFGLLTLGPALFFLGLVFPRLMQSLPGDSASDARGLSLLLACNGIGGFLGAEIAQSLLVPGWGLHLSLGILGTLYAAVAVGAEYFQKESHVKPLKKTGIGCVIGLFLLTAVWLRTLPHHNLHMNLKVLEEFFGRDGPVLAAEHPIIGKAIVMSNQYVLGSTSVRHDQERQAHLPLLLHRNPRDVAFIGLATGITPGAGLLHSDVNVTAIELSQQVVNAAQRHFGEFNHDLLRSQARIVVEDGRTYLASCDGNFDVVVGDLFLPWGAGEGRLFSVEHFRAVNNSLRPGGVFCQWLPMYQLTPEQFSLIARTFARVFPRVQLFRGTFGLTTPTLALVGFRDSELNWKVIADRCASIKAGTQVRDPLIHHREGVGMLYLGECEISADSAAANSVNTLDNLMLELLAGGERLTGRPGKKYLQGMAWLNFLEQNNDRSFPVESKDFSRDWPEWGLLISRWEAAHALRASSESQLQRDVLQVLPKRLFNDAIEHPEYWAGDSHILRDATRELSVNK